MAKFDAGSALEPMEWDFTAYGGGKGVIPEPTETVLKEAQDRIKELMRQVADQLSDEHLQADLDAAVTGDALDLRKMQQMVDNLDGADFTAQSDGMTAAVALMCQDSPDATQIGLLPFRVRTAFFGWVMGEMFNPEALSGATPHSPIPIGRSSSSRGGTSRSRRKTG